MPFRIRQAQHDDVQALRPLRHALWPGCPEPKHDIEIAQLLSSGGQLFLAEDADRNVVGFAEVSLRRDHVEGASISPVPYLEGWFVAPSSRRKGIGRALLGAVEDWAVSRGFSELASDAGISNERSIRLHRQLGFAEVEHTVSFLKRLRPAPAQESSVGPSNPQYVLRPATNDDRPAIERLIFGVLVEHGLEPDPASTDADLGDIESAYHARGGFFDVLVDDERAVIGTVGLFRVDNCTCELRKMYLHPDLRGRGLGRRLLDHALKRAAALGYRRMILETASVLRRAIRLYERCGFQRFSPSHLASRCDAAYSLDLPFTEERDRTT